MTRPPRPLCAAAVTAVGHAILLTAIVGATYAAGALAAATGLPWLPYVAIIVTFGVAMGALRYRRERSRAKRAAEPSDQ